MRCGIGLALPLGVAAASVAAGIAVACEFDSALGQIDKLSRRSDADVVLERAGKSTPAPRLALLCRGDAVEVRNDAIAEIRVSARPGVVRLDKDYPRIVIEGPEPGSMRTGSEFSERIRRTLSVIFERDRPPIFVRTSPRTADDKEADNTRGQAELRHHPGLSAGRQYWTGTAPRLAVVWGGSATSVELVGAGDQLLRGINARKLSSVRFELEPNERTLLRAVSIRGLSGGKTLRFDLIGTDSLPAPGWLDRKRPLSPAEELSWLLWLIEQRGPEWRLEALSRLAALAERWYSAERLWYAVEAEELNLN